MSDQVDAIQAFDAVVEAQPEAAVPPDGVPSDYIQMTDEWRAVCLRIFNAFGFTDTEADLTMNALPGTYAACRTDQSIWWSPESRLRLYNLWYMNKKAGWPTYVINKYHRNGLRGRKAAHPLELRRWMRVKQSLLGGHSPAALMCADKKRDSRAVLAVYNVFAPFYWSPEQQGVY